VPDHQRGQAVGIASSGLLAVQGIGLLLGGVVAGALGVGWAVGGAGLVGMLLALSLSMTWSALNPRIVNAPARSGGQHRPPA